MLAKLKGILTPEQYVKFLENNFVNQRDNMPRKGDRPADVNRKPRRDHR